MIKLIASDLDGTLLHNGAQELSPYTIDLVHRITEKGIHFVAASGRQYDNTRQLVLTLNESQKTLWESNWSSSIMNTNVVVASSSYTTAIKVNLVTQGNPTPAPLEGVTVTVYDSAENGNVIGTWTTNAEGIALVEHTQSTIYYTISKTGYSDTVLESVSGPNGVIAGWRVVGVDEDGNFEYLDYKYNL